MINKNDHNNRNHTKKLTQLKNNLNMGDKLDEIMSYIDIAKQNIRSAALFLCKVKGSLK
ncbi:hypothetical protein [Borreliella garinii]|uniref:hypothetical protein n=1 Tax=Borreliella garinii TaxID=29519 RepID=UPI003FA429A1